MKFMKYIIGIMWCVALEVVVGEIKILVHGFRTHELHFSPDFEPIAALLGFLLIIIAMLIWVPYLMERFFTKREERIIFVASMLVTSFLTLY